MFFRRRTVDKQRVKQHKWQWTRPHLFWILGNQLLWAHTFFWHFLSAMLLTVMSFTAHVSVHLSSLAASNIVLFSPLSWFLCSHRNWQTFWRSVTWCSPAFSAWRCCWSSWLWGSLATSKTLIMASTASLSSSGEALLPSALRLCTECSPRLASIVRLILKNVLNMLCSKSEIWGNQVAKSSFMMRPCSSHRLSPS